MNKNHILEFFTFCFSLFVLVACNSNDKTTDATGVFEATEVVVSAKAQGEVISFTAEEGDDVALGQTLGTIDIRQLSLRKDQLKATQTATESKRVNIEPQLAALRQQRANLLKEKSRFEQLLEANAASQKQVDDIKYQISVVDKQIAGLQDQLSTQNSALTTQSNAIDPQISQVDEQINDATIKSPIKGTILEKYIEQGEYAVPGKPLFKVANLEDMTLRAYVTADQYNALKLKQQVQVFIDGNENAYEGVVSWISQRAEFTPKTIQTKDERANLVYAIKIRVKNDGLLKIGMYGEVIFN